MTSGGDDDTLAAPAAGASASAAPKGDDYPELIVVDRAHYAIGAELARGGMGKISTARDRRLGRAIAIKELLVRDADLAARFEREARITAQLQHPSIVNVHEAGRWSTGEPFYAMKLVAGRPLDQVIAEEKTLAARLALLPHAIAVVDALAYAHSERVIHRDLKPSNVLVGAYGETVVIDWGLAKDLASDEPAPPAAPYRAGGRGDETTAGAVLGTPAYMPPEQARGQAVDARADVYALGALLYHLLAGAPPYAGKRADDVLAQVLAGPPPPLATRAPDAPPDLAAIVARAMAREPADRFPSAREMAEELKRFQTGQLVTSHRYTTWQLIRRWLRRHRGPVAVGAIALVALAAIGAFSLRRVLDEKARADDAAARAETARARAEERNDELLLAQAETALDRDPTAALRWLAQVGDHVDVAAVRRIAADAASRGVAHVLDAGDRVHGLAVAPDGARVAAGVGRRVRVWDLATWRDVALDGHAHDVADVAFAADGSIVSIDLAGEVRRWDARGAATIVRPAGATILRATIAPGAARIALVDERDGVIVWQAGAPERALPDPYRQIAWSTTGARLFVEDDEQKIHAVDPATGAMTDAAAGNDVEAIAGDDRRVIIGRIDGTLYERSGAGPMKPQGMQLRPRHAGPVTRLVLGDDGAVISASGDVEQWRGVEVMQRSFHPGDQTIAVWRDGRVTRFRGQGADFDALAYTHGVLASAGADGQIRVWTFPDETIDASRWQSVTAAVAEGARFVIGSGADSIDAYDLGTGALRAATRSNPKFHIEPDGTTVIDTEWSILTTLVVGGDRAASIDSAGNPAIWDLAAGRGDLLDGQAAQIAITPDGARVATASPDGAVDAWDETTRARTPIAPAGAQVTALAYRGDGATLAVARDDGRVTLYGAGPPIALASPATPLRALAFAGAGTVIAGGDDGLVRVWDVASRRLRTLTGHHGTITRVSLAPDGASFATAGNDKTVRVWRLADGASVVLRGHTGGVGAITWSRDGRTILTASDDRTVRVWDRATGASRVLRGHDEIVLAAAFTPDERRIVSIDRDGELDDDADDLPRDLPGLRAWIARATGQR